jgi:predicted AlkP superfamily phosphohydrolase/phosphomutase
MVFWALLLSPLAVWLENPIFIASLPEYVQVVGGSGIVFFFARSAVAFVLRATSRPDVTRARVSQALGLGAATGLLGFLPGGLAGAALGFLPFAILAFFATRTAVPSWTTLIASIAAVASVAVLAFALRAPAAANQVVWFALDGATWPIMDDLIEDDRIPRIGEMIENGASAGLEVIDPVISPPLWTSIATGRTPEVHGVKDFWATSKQVRSKRIWDVADENGLSSGVFGYLVTWPPEKSGGFLVPGWLAQDSATYPPSLSFIKELEIGGKAERNFSLGELIGFGVASLRHGVTVGTTNKLIRFFLSRKFDLNDGTQQALDARLVKVDIAADVFRHLLKRTQPDLAIFFTSGVDAIEHMFFKYFRPEGFTDVTNEDVERFGDAIPMAYEAADRAVDVIASVASPNANFVIVSDHGQTSATEQRKLWYVIKTTNLLELLEIPDDVRPTNAGAVLYLRKDGEIPDPWSVRTALESVVRVRDGKPLFRVKASSRGELQVGVADDFIAEDGDKLLVGGEEVGYERIVEPAARISGVHTRTAVFVLQGPAAVSGVRLARGSVLDVAPTTLALLELPVARDLEGRVIEEAFVEPIRARLPVAYVDTYGERGAEETADSLNESVLDRLKTLGYVE